MNIAMSLHPVGLSLSDVICQLHILTKKIYDSVKALDDFCNSTGTLQDTVDYRKCVLKICSEFNAKDVKCSYIYGLRRNVQILLEYMSNVEQEDVLKLINDIPNNHALTAHEIALGLIEQFESKPFDQNKKDLIYNLDLFCSLMCELSILSLPHSPKAHTIYGEIFIDLDKLYKQLLCDMSPKVTPSMYETINVQINGVIAVKYQQAYGEFSNSFVTNKSKKTQYLKRESRYISEFNCLRTVQSCLDLVKCQLFNTQQPPVETQPAQPHHPQYRGLEGVSPPHMEEKTPKIDINLLRTNSTDFKAFINILQGLKNTLQIKLTSEQVEKIVAMGIEEKVLDKTTIDILELCKSLNKA
jgi:hypothetical protein